MSEKSFLYSMMTDQAFRRVAGSKVEVDRDIRRGEWVICLRGERFVWIPRELNDDPDALEAYAVGAIHHMMEHGDFCDCERLRESVANDDLADDYRLQWHKEVHGEPPPRIPPSWPKWRALQKAGADVVMAARKQRDEGDGADLDVALAAYDRMEETDPWEFLNKSEAVGALTEVAP